VGDPQAFRTIRWAWCTFRLGCDPTLAGGVRHSQLKEAHIHASHCHSELSLSTGDSHRIWALNTPPLVNASKKAQLRPSDIYDSVLSQRASSGETTVVRFAHRVRKCRPVPCGCQPWTRTRGKPSALSSVPFSATLSTTRHASAAHTTRVLGRSVTSSKRCRFVINNQHLCIVSRGIRSRQITCSIAVSQLGALGSKLWAKEKVQESHLTQLRTYV
jgi:hypothetical protein